MTAWLQNEKPNFAQKEFLINPFCKVEAFPNMETFNGYRNIFKKEGLRIVKFKDITIEARKSVDDFYIKLFQIIKEFNSLEYMSKIVKDSSFLKILTTRNFRKTAEDAFLGPIYAKLCLDAGVFKLGYFFLENK